jgi:hypothetical protein
MMKKREYFSMHEVFPKKASLHIGTPTVEQLHTLALCSDMLAKPTCTIPIDLLV